MVEVVGKRGSEELCAKITETLESKGVQIEHLRFHGLDGTNTMSGERFVNIIVTVTGRS